MGKRKRFVTDFLTVDSNFLTGAGTVMSLEGNYYHFNESENGQEADSNAIRNDFNMVGQDILNALENVNQ